MLLHGSVWQHQSIFQSGNLFSWSPAPDFLLNETSARPRRNICQCWGQKLKQEEDRPPDDDKVLHIPSWKSSVWSYDGHGAALLVFISPFCAFFTQTLAFDEYVGYDDYEYYDEYYDHFDDDYEYEKLIIIL